MTLLANEPDPVPSGSGGKDNEEMDQEEEFHQTKEDDDEFQPDYEGDENEEDDDEVASDKGYYSPAYVCEYQVWPTTQMKFIYHLGE